MRGALAGESHFTVKAQLVPCREGGATVVGANGALLHATGVVENNSGGAQEGGASPASSAGYVGDYLSNASSVTAHVQLLTPLPQAHYVPPRFLATPFPETGPFAHRQHLSRAVFVFPYAGQHTQRLLQGLMAALLRFTRASEGAGRITEVPPPEASTPRPRTAPAEEEPGGAPLGRKGSQLQQQTASPTAGGGGGKGGKKGAIVEEREPPSPEEELRLFAETIPPRLDDLVFTVPEGVSGFEVIDGDSRIIVIEGYPFVLHALVEVCLGIAGPALSTESRRAPDGLSTLKISSSSVSAPAASPSASASPLSSPLLAPSDEMRVLFNTDLVFPQRWYHSWPDLVRPMPEFEARMASYGYSGISGLLGGRPVGGSSDGATAGDGNGARVGTAESVTSASPQPPPGLEQAPEQQSPKAKGEGKRGAKPPKLTPAQRQAIADAAAAEQRRIEREQELAAEAEAEANRKAALRGERDELDGGGVGGRIRRIRLSKSLGELAGTQRNFMRRFMSGEALSCVSKLIRLRDAPSVAHALAHDCFPTAEEMTALERVRGDALSVFDICGSETYYSFEAGMEHAARSDAARAQELDSMEALRRRSERKAAVPVTELLSRGLSMAHVGRMLLFVGTPAHPSQLGRLPRLTPDYFPRHAHKNYMLVEGATDPATGGPLYVLCCYPNPPPTQLLRHYCNAQVASAAERAEQHGQGTDAHVPILFVLHCETVAKNGSDDRNPAYEEHLRREARRLPYREYGRVTALKRAHYLATHRGGAGGGLRASQSHGGGGGTDSDEEDAEGFIDPPPFAPPEDGADPHAEDLIEDMLVENDYVHLNTDTAATLKKWGKPVSDAPRRERAARAALHAQCQEMYDAQTARLAAAEGGDTRHRHSQRFVSGAAKSSTDARRHPKAIGKGDTINDGPWVPHGSVAFRGEAGPVSAEAAAARASHPHPMSFSGGSTAVEKTNVDTLLPPAFRSRLEAAQASGPAGATAAEEARAAEERARQAAEEWKERLVVDSAHFSVNTRRPRDKPMSSIDQYQSMLEGPPLKPTIRKNYAPPAPPSIRTAERVVPMGRVEPYESKHPERHTFYLPSGGSERTFLRDVPPVSEEERASSPLYKH